jgi:SUMO ligase MMS21 Smc5/6 complex component
MIVTKKVEGIDQSMDGRQTFTALDQPIEVNLKNCGKEWIGHTNRLQRGMYVCKVVYHLQWDGLGEELIVVDKNDELD